MTSIKVVAMNGAKLPTKAHPDDAGWDVTAITFCLIPPGERLAVPTGLYLEIPRGWEVQVRSRSGMALKQGICVLNAPGTIDANYRGEVCVILYNTTEDHITINQGDRIAQLVPARVEDVSFEEVSELTPSDRGSGGFGSTGR